MSTAMNSNNNWCSDWEEDDTVEILFGLFYFPRLSWKKMCVDFSRPLTGHFISSEGRVEALGSSITSAGYVLNSDVDGTIEQTLNRIARRLLRAYSFKYDPKIGPKIETVLGAYEGRVLIKKKHAKRDKVIRGIGHSWREREYYWRGDPLTYKPFPQVFDPNQWRLIKDFHAVVNGETRYLTKQDRLDLSSLMRTEVRCGIGAHQPSLGPDDFY